MSKTKPASPFPNLWDDSSLRAYLGEIRRRHGIIETLALPSMRDLPPLRIESLFVQPLLAESPVSVDSDPDTWPEGKSLLETLQEHRQMVVLGDPGGGKTTLSNWLAWRLSAGLTTPLPPVLENRVPLPCVLREMPTDIFRNSVTIADLAESIATRLLGSKADNALRASLRARVKAGSYVLILDGVDEIPVPNRKTVADWIKSAHLQEACVLATSRIVGYEDWPVDRLNIGLTAALKGVSSWKELITPLISDVEAANLSLNETVKQGWLFPTLSNKSTEGGFTSKQLREFARTSLAWAQLRYLMPFDQRRIAAFVENWYHQRCGSEQDARQKSSDLLAALAQSDATRQLARTPNLLGLMAIVHRERAHLPDGKALLYDEIANAYINTIDAQRKILPGDILARYSWEERRAWLAYIGFQMQQLRNPRQLDGKGAEKGVLASEKDVLGWLAEAMRQAGVEQPEDIAKLFLKWVARRSGLLLPRGEERYAFVHLSFQEYFCAWHLYGVMDHPDFSTGASTDSVIADIREKLPSWSRQSSWRETLIYLFELLSAKRNPHWAKVLVDILFGTDEESPDLFGDQAALASRLLTDRHIRLGEQKRDQLAECCCMQAWSDWRFLVEHDSFILSALRDTGYAAIVGSTRPADVSNSALPLPPEPDYSTFDEIADKTRTRLRLCFFMRSDIRNIAPLAALDNLRVLHLDNTQVSDVAPLAGLDNLRVLHLDNTQVSDVAPLAALDNLRELHLDNTQVSDVVPLAGLINLRRLGLAQTEVADITPLDSLINLENIDLASTKVADVAPLSELVNLEQLNLGGTKVVDISPLAKLYRLRALFLENTRVADIAPLAGLTSLWWLGLGYTQVTNIASLSGLTNLEGLFISGTQISDISSVAGFSKLEYLSISHSLVKDLTPLTKLSQLYFLDLEHTTVTDITPLTGLGNLRRLNLDHTQVSDVTPLAKLTNLRFLSLVDTQVTDVTPLAGIEQLEISSFSAKAISTTKVRRKKKSKK